MEEGKKVTSISFPKEVWTLFGISLSPGGAPSFLQNLDVQDTWEMSPAFTETHKQNGLSFLVFFLYSCSDCLSDTLIQCCLCHST